MAETSRETRDGAAGGSSCGENSSGVGSDGDGGVAPSPLCLSPGGRARWDPWTGGDSGGQGHTRGLSCFPHGQGRGCTVQGWSLNSCTTTARAGDTCGTGDTRATSPCMAQMAPRHRVIDRHPPCSRRLCRARAIPVVPPSSFGVKPCRIWVPSAGAATRALGDDIHPFPAPGQRGCAGTVTQHGDTATIPGCGSTNPQLPARPGINQPALLLINNPLD